MISGIVAVSYAIGSEMKVVKSLDSLEGHTKLDPNEYGGREFFRDDQTGEVKEYIPKTKELKEIGEDELAELAKKGTSASTDTAIKNIGESMIYALMIWGLVETFGGMFGSYARGEDKKIAILIF